MPIYEGIGAITDKLTVVIDIGAAYTKYGCFTYVVICVLHWIVFI